MYVYLQSERHLFTVGHYDPEGRWFPESDWISKADAVRRVAELNGTPQDREEWLENVLAEINVRLGAILDKIGDAK